MYTVEDQTLDSLEDWLEHRLELARRPIGGRTEQDAISAACYLFGRDTGLQLTPDEMRDALYQIYWQPVQRAPYVVKKRAINFEIRPGPTGNVRDGERPETAGNA